MRIVTTWILGFWVVCAAASIDAVVLVEGDWVVVDPDANAIYRIDPATFDVEEISSGGDFRFPTGVTSSGGGAIRRRSRCQRDHSRRSC